MQVLRCNNDHIFNQMFNNIVTINTLNNNKIHIKYDPQVQSIQTIWKWFFNEFKYKCDDFNEYNYKFVDENNVEIPITSSINETKAITNTTKKFKLMLKPKASYGEHVQVEYNPDKFKKSDTSVMIYLKTLTGKSLTIHINDMSNVTVDELKLFVQDSEGPLPDQQRFIFNGRQLEDGNTLESYGLKLESVIHLVLRLRGGMFNEVSGRNGAYEPLLENFYDITCYK